MVRDTARSPAEVEAEAAAWLARLHGPHRSADTDAALKAWLRADPAHEEAFGRATEVWDLLPGLAATPPSSATPERRARHIVFAMAASLLLLLSVGGGYFLLGRPPVHETAVGEQQVVMLDDGTRVSLNTDSRIAILYSAGERRVRLDRGEAMFEVSHNPARPFIVEAGDEQVRALGTTFIVRRDGDARMAVTLIEGRVEVTEPNQARAPRIAMLAPGQRVTVTATAGAALDRPSIEAVTAWRRGEVMFEDTSLLDAAEELNRYNAEHLVIADPSLASLRISGVFSTGDLEEAARAIAVLHHLHARREGGEIRLTQR
jgi:transmembrane sensor